MKMYSEWYVFGLLCLLTLLHASIQVKSSNSMMIHDSLPHGSIFVCAFGFWFALRRPTFMLGASDVTKFH